MSPDNHRHEPKEDKQGTPTPLESPGAAGGGAGRMAYRAMREDASGGPMIGPTARTLGVRPQVDIAVIGGLVRPNTGGMSVAPDRPENLHPLRRPPQYGGSGKDPVWALDLARLGAGLRFRQDSPTHGLIEPSSVVSLAEYERRLADTKPFWKKLP
jgi:hypothetical protein